MDKIQFKVDGDIVCFSEKEKSYIDLTIHFNEKEFDFYDIKNSYLDNGELYEFLPSIYYKETKKSVCDKLSKRINSTKRFRKLFYTLLHAVFFVYQNQKVEYIIQVRNKRDKIKIVQSNKNNDKKVIYSNTCVKKENKIITEYRLSEYDLAPNEYKYVDTNKIFYPDGLGGGANRCIIWYLFQTLGLMNTFNDKYNVMLPKDMLECSSINKKLLDTCKNFSRCKGLLDKYKKGTYDIHCPEEFDIKLTEFKGYFIPEEGKHRVCIAKRFGIPQIYAKVSKMVNIKEKRGINNSSYMRLNSCYSMKEVLDSCYNTFREIGVTKEHVRYILESGMSDSDLLDYIEIVTNKQLKDIVMLVRHGRIN